MTSAPDTGTGKDHTGWLCTYYIYDDFRNLTGVIQPNGVEILAANNWHPGYGGGVITNENAFIYTYDSRGRMTSKKVPGAGFIRMIYDYRDRLVMTQDANLYDAQKWQYILYDRLNRPIATGLITDTANYDDPGYHQTYATGSENYPNPSNYPDELLSKTFYDDYAWRSGEGNPLSGTRNTAYDTHLLTASNTSFPYPQDATNQNNMLRGMITGKKTKVLGTASTFLYGISFFDHQGKQIQKQSTNITTGIDVETTQYTWNSQPVLSILKNEKPTGTAEATVIVTKFNFDNLFRLSSIEKKIGTSKVNSGALPGSWKVITEQEYDALGKLKKKELGSTPSESLNYEYNIRGWMLGANRNYVKDTTSVTNWFGFDLGYDKTSFSVNGSTHSYLTAQYNGNVNGMLWRSTGDDYLRKYDFTYDAVNRFLSADFNQLNSNNFSKAAGLNSSVHGMSYDANGNILSMNQKGWKLGGSVTIDSLYYGYIPGYNKLQYVYELANDSNTYLGDFREFVNNSTQDYSYDNNGNLTTDANKRITLINYNHLNLPDSIRVNGKGIIKFVYDAVGNKLKKITVDSTGGTVRVNSTVYMIANYLNDTLQYISTEEGRARVVDDSSEVVYDYMIKDHLGNVRMVLTEETRADQYPGASMEDANATIEESLYDNISGTRSDLPAGYPTISGNNKVAKVWGNFFFGAPHLEIGPGKLLKVMAGDFVDFTVNSWWNSYLTPDPPSSSYGLNQLIQSINGSAIIQNSHYSGTAVASSVELNTSLGDFLNSQTHDTQKPKAFLNWIAFDERFNYVASNSGFDQVGADSVYTTHTKLDLLVEKNGYVYIYVSNETPNIDVFFDNLQVTHSRGPLLQEEHYYPFGLTMAGISSKALAFGEPKNKKGYVRNEIQNKEFSDGSGLELYDFNARTYDQQIGRFIQIDPLPEEANQEGWSPYHYSYNNPITYSDPDGKCPCFIIPIIKAITAAVAAGTTTYVVVKSYENSDLDLNLSLPVATGAGTAAPSHAGGANIEFRIESQIAKASSISDKAQASQGTGNLTQGARMLAKGGDKSTTTTTKKDRVANQKPGEKAQNHLEGIQKRQEKLKKIASSIGEKQKAIESTKKSEQKLKTELKNVRNLKDVEENF